MKIQDSFELSELSELLADLMGNQYSGAVPPAMSERTADTVVLKKGVPNLQTPPSGESVAAQSSADFKEDHLLNILKEITHLGGFTGAVLTDAQGLPLAIFQCPFSHDAVAAIVALMSHPLEKVASILSVHEINQVAMDMGYTDQLVLRKFKIKHHCFYFMIICSQSQNPRDEMELYSQQLREALLQNVQRMI